MELEFLDISIHSVFRYTFWLLQHLYPVSLSFGKGRAEGSKKSRIKARRRFQGFTG